VIGHGEWTGVKETFLGLWFCGVEYAACGPKFKLNQLKKINGTLNSPDALLNLSKNTQKWAQFPQLIEQNPKWLIEKIIPRSQCLECWQTDQEKIKRIYCASKMESKRNERQ
jgi:hypothetical protein